MIVLDTHAWLWWVNGSTLLSGNAAGAIAASDRIGVCVISCWEVGMLVAKGRLTLDREIGRWVIHALSRPRVELLPILPEIALAAAALNRRFHGDPMDRLLVCTAQPHRCPIVTIDRKITESGLIPTIW